jgi:adenosylhomocysteine nucleosidase
MKIGIMGAMIEEIVHLKRAIQQSSHHERGRREFTSGMLQGHEVVVVFSRWGKVAASSTATTLIEHFGVDLLIFTGVAGAIDEELNVGDIVIGSQLVQHDMDASAIPGIKKFEIPLLGLQFFEPPSHFVAKAKLAAQTYFKHHSVAAEILAKFDISHPKVVTGLIASGDQFIASGTVANALRQHLPHLQCVEMEGAAVAQVAYEHNIPCLVVRTISDKANSTAPLDFPVFLQEVAAHFTCGSVLHLLDELHH